MYWDGEDGEDGDGEDGDGEENRETLRVQYMGIDLC